MDSPSLFLSYNSVDRPSVVAVQTLLAARGITTFLDRDQLAPGLPWPAALEDGLRTVRAVAVFIGRELGGWQKREMYFALDRQVREEKQGHPFPVIPVLLAGADPTPSFLFLNTWIDLRSGLDFATVAEPLEAFERAVTATAPATGSDAERTVALCPYRGLEAFREEHAAFFAGRTAFASTLFNFTERKELVAVIGPSGSGKSSVVQAGLVPLLRRQLPPATTWDVVTFSPGSDPFRRLASCLAPLLEPDRSETDRLAEAKKLGEHLASGGINLESVIDRVIDKSNGTGRLLVVTDQFEELFTLTPVSKRRPFAEALVRALGKARFTLLVMLRADFYSQIIALDRELSDRLVPAQVNIGALTRDELRESIVCPSKLVGLEFEAGLVDRILDDVGSEPGNLPLLEFALTEIWNRRKGSLLTNRAYGEIGGATGALAVRAETEFGRLNPEERVAARRLFSRLVRLARPDEAGEDTRQRAKLSDADEIAIRVANQFADARLLVTGAEASAARLSVDLAHEALIRNWVRLRDWLNEDREFVLWRQRLQAQVQEWQDDEREAGYLFRGAPLSEAERWLLERPQDLSEPEQKFIQESVAVREQERQEIQQRQRAEIENLKRLKEIAEAKAEAERAVEDLKYQVTVLSSRLKHGVGELEPDASVTSSEPSPHFSVPQLAHLYDFPVGCTGRGQVIGIVELGGGFADSDLDTYFAQLNIRKPEVSWVSVDGTKNSPSGDPNGPDGQVTLDIEVAGSVAPGAKILVYFAPNTNRGFLDAILSAVADSANRPSILSISWGGPEANWTLPAMKQMNKALESAAATGITVVCAAGDLGVTDGVANGRPNVDFPSSSPWVLSCGGTYLQASLTASGHMISSEVVWNDSADAATGHGVSNVFPLPKWQSHVEALDRQDGRRGRRVPDVAACASPRSGYRVFIGGRTTVVGGTAAATPLWAGLIALINEGLGRNLGYFNPILYSAIGPQGVLRAVTDGNSGDRGTKQNSGRLRWNATTGWGSPRGNKILKALRKLKETKTRA